MHNQKEIKNKKTRPGLRQSNAVQAQNCSMLAHLSEKTY